MANEANQDFTPNDELVGDIKHQEIVKTVEIHRLPKDHVNRYHIRQDSRSMTGNYILNLATVAAGMEPDSMLELGGDRWKRVTHTETEAGEKYVYVEVGERE